MFEFSSRTTAVWCKETHSSARFVGVFTKSTFRSLHQALMFLSSSPQSECRRSIMKDLGYYDRAIRSYLQSQLHKPEKEEIYLRPVLTVIQNLRKVRVLCQIERNNVQKISWETTQTYCCCVTNVFLVSSGLLHSNKCRERFHRGIFLFLLFVFCSWFASCGHIN